MKSVRALRQTLRQDRVLSSVLRNSGYLFSSQTISMGLSLVQSIFAARLLGVSGFGVLGIITVFASTVNRLFSFRMGELVVKYLGADLTNNRLDRVGALVKAAGLTEGISSLLAFAVVVWLSPLAALYFTKDSANAPYFMVFGLSVIGSLIAETATGVLQTLDKFRSQAVVNLVQSVITAAIILYAYLTQAGMWLVVLAYLIGKVILNAAPVFIAWRGLDLRLGRGWWKAPFSLLPPWRELFNFAFSSNFSATINMLARDSEVLWVGLFLSPLAVGYYKVALAIINPVLMPITPFISTTYPEITRHIAAHEYPQLRRLLKRVTLISGGWTVLAALVLAIFGPWLLLLYGPGYAPAYPAMMVLLVGFGIANIFFWNRPLNLALGEPGFPFRMMLWCGLAKVLLAFVLVPRFGYVAEAVLLSGYFIVTISLILWKGFALLCKAEQAGNAG